MDLAAVMDEIGDALDTIDGLRVFRYPPDGPPSPPAAIVTYPEDITFDATYGRGADRMTLPVVVLVGRVSDRSARDRLAAYAAGSGARSVKQTVEGATYAALDDLRVIEAEFDVYTVGGVDFLAATFRLDIVGSGS